MHWREDNLFNKWCWENWISICRKLKLDSSFSPCIRLNLKMDLNGRPETVKQLQKRIGKTLEHVGIGNNFVNRTPIAQQLRESIEICDYIKSKGFCTANEKVIRQKRNPTEWEKTFTSYTSELRKLNLQRMNNPMNKWRNELNRQLSKELQM
jgi:hypothetical protein